MIGSMSLARPLFRHDLVSQAVDEGGLRFVDVTDPSTGGTFRFYEVEYAMACAMDGHRDIDGLVGWARDELGIEPSKSELGTVVTTLGDLGYLEGVAGKVAPPPSAEASAEIALGNAGRSPMGRINSPAPVAIDDVPLGAAGASDAPAAASGDGAHPTAAVELGAAGGVAEFGARGSNGAGAAPIDEDHEVTRIEPAPGPPTEPLPEEEEFEMEVQPAATGNGAAAHGIPDGGASIEADAPPSVEMEIGPPAAVPEHTPPPMPAVKPPAAPADVSVDLSQHLEIDADDVKEAVRQSKAVAIPDLPEDLQDALEEEPEEILEAPEPLAGPPVAVEGKRPPTLPQQPPGSAPRVPTAADAVGSIAAVEPNVGAAPMELPDAKARVSSPAMQVAAPVEAPTRKKSGGALKLLVFLLFLGGLGAGWWFFGAQISEMIGYDITFGIAPGGSSGETSSSDGKATDGKSGKDASDSSGDKAGDKASADAKGGAGTGETGDRPEKAPDLPVAILRTAMDEREVKAPKSGTIAWLAPAEEPVAEGAIIARYATSAQIDKQIKDTQSRLQHYQRKFDQATEAKNVGAIKAAQNKITEKEKRIASLEKSLDPHVVRAPAAGTVELKIEAGARVNEGDDLFRLTVPSGPRAEFELEDVSGYEVGGKVTVHDQEEKETSVECDISEVDGNKVAITCPADSGVYAGRKVVLEK